MKIQSSKQCINDFKKSPILLLKIYLGSGAMALPVVTSGSLNLYLISASLIWGILLAVTMYVITFRKKEIFSDAAKAQMLGVFKLFMILSVAIGVYYVLCGSLFVFDRILYVALVMFMGFKSIVFALQNRW